VEISTATSTFCVPKIVVIERRERRQVDAARQGNKFLKFLGTVTIKQTTLYCSLPKRDIYLIHGNKRRGKTGVQEAGDNLISSGKKENKLFVRLCFLHLKHQSSASPAESRGRGTLKPQRIGMDPKS
jgi:hypothetical protein